MTHLVLRGFIVEYVKELRKDHPMLGCEKLYVMCKTYFGTLFDIGRDAFYRILRENKLMLRLRRRKHCRTTDSEHPYPLYPNLIRDYKPVCTDRLWVCDITYIWTSEGFCFLSLVTDAYSHQIIGYKLAPSLAYHYTEEALDMALSQAGEELDKLIHHSDRGFQYAYYKYVNKLNKRQIKISMTENGDPLENAVAERVNGILKQEWLHHHQFKDIEDVRRILDPAIAFYNHHRPHASIDMLTPVQARECSGELKKRWKNKTYKKKGTTQSVA